MDRLKDSFATLTSADGWKDMMEDEGLEYGHGLNLGGVLEKLDGSKEQLFKKDEEIVFPDTNNYPFYRVLEGSVRVVTDDEERYICAESSWPIISEYSIAYDNKPAMKLTGGTSSCRVQMVPREVLFKYCQLEGAEDFASLFFEAMFHHYAKSLRKFLYPNTSADRGGLTLRGEASVFSTQVTVRHHKGGLGKSSERVFGISRSYMGIFKVRERGRPLEGKETKGEIIEISHVEGISCENKRFRVKADETSILFKWERGNPKQLGSAIGVVLHVDDSGDFEGVWEKDKPPNERSQVEKNWKFGLTDSDINYFKARGRVDKIASGETFLSKGSTVQEILVLLSGDYRVGFEEESEQTFDYKFIGEMLYMCDCPAYGNYIGGENGCTILRVPFSIIISHSRHHPLFLIRLYQSFLLQLWRRIKDCEIYFKGREGPQWLSKGNSKDKHGSDPEVGISTRSSSFRQPIDSTFNLFASGVNKTLLSPFMSEAQGKGGSETPETKRRKKFFESRTPTQRSKTPREKSPLSTKKGEPVGGRKRSGSMDSMEMPEMPHSFTEREKASSFIETIMNPTGEKDDDGSQASGFLDYVAKEEEGQSRHKRDISNGGYFDSLVDPLSEAAGHATTKTFTDLDDSVTSHRSAVVGFQLDEMLYATKLTELRQWKDTCIEGVGGLLGVVDSLHEFHSLLVQAAWSGSLAEIDRVFTTIEWRGIYLSYHSRYPETLRALAKLNISVFEMDRISRLLASPLKRLNDYFAYYGNLSTKDYKEIPGKEIQERMTEFQFVMGKCQEIMCLYYLNNLPQ